MKTNANKSAASAAFPSTRFAAPARSLRASRSRLAGSETRPATEKRLKVVGSVEPKQTRSSAQKARNLRVAPKPTLAPEKPLAGRAERESAPAPAKETRSAPVVSPSAPPTHAGRGDATLARYMTELAGYELLGRDDEIRLAQEVENLEIAYWGTLLSQPRAVAELEKVICSKLEEQPTKLTLVVRASRAARATGASKTARTRYTRAVERAAVELRGLDLHREAAKATHEAVLEFADNQETTRGARTKLVENYVREVERARRTQQAAKDRFVAANLRLVVSMARRYAREGRMPLADLIQEGNLGLMKAVERFDHRRGFRFSTYASWWIRHALTRGLADKGRLVRLPVHALETRTRLARAVRKLTCRTGVAPTLDELAAETGLPPEKLTAVEELSTEAPFSLDAPMGGDNDRTFLDMLRYEDQPSAETAVVTESHKESLASLLGELSPFEAQILRYRYGFDGGEERTLKEIGQMYNLSRERIRQIQACALAKMRARVEDGEDERAAL